MDLYRDLRDVASAIPYEFYLAYGGIVGANCVRPRAVTDRPYGFYLRWCVMVGADIIRPNPPGAYRHHPPLGKGGLMGLCITRQLLTPNS